MNIVQGRRQDFERWVIHLLFSQKYRIFTVNFKKCFCVADFHGQFQIFLPKGVVHPP
jgi:hypothetical protein